MQAFRYIFSWRSAWVTGLLLALAACDGVWNSPYPHSQTGRDILYSAFTERPKHLDPARAYTDDELTFLGQIYDAPLQYHYLKRPYTLIPATLATLPTVTYRDAQGRTLSPNVPAEQVAESVYELRLKPGLRFQRHPAFAKDPDGRPLYLALSEADLKDRFTPADFPEQATREVTADDFIYEIKRLAHPNVHSPIAAMMADKIVGLAELGKTLQKAVRERKGWINLDEFPLSGVEKVDRLTWRIRIKGRYPQFQYWLAMPFFAPVPREVDQFYSQPGMAERNLTLDQWPVGTGAFVLAEFDPNRRIVLEKNPEFRQELYPCEGEVADQAAGLLADCGKPLPLISRAVFSREKESIPYWNKFLQGYYDASGISSDSFDQAVRVGVDGDVGLSDEMRARGIRLLTSVKPSTFYMGFNLLDPVVGGMSESAAKLRQAISIAIDQEEYISIFMNGRGVAAQSPIPPGFFGFDPQAVNPYVYDRDTAGHAHRKSVEEARRLLAEAGYPHGRHRQTGEPLILNLDTTGSGMGEKSRLDWLTRQFAKIDIQLVVRSTDFNRFQDKLQKGNAQLYYLGWNADYPDPENFLFLLNGAEGKVRHGGENTSNYANATYDHLFLRMKAMDNTPARQALIHEMLGLLQHDAPWVFGLHPQSYTLGHAWLYNRKPTDVGNNILKYQRIDAEARERARAEWNPPVTWPLYLLAGLVLVGTAVWRRRSR